MTSSQNLLQDLKSNEGRIAVRDVIAAEEWTHRKELSKKIIQAFIGVNIAVIIAIGLIFLIEALLIYHKILDYKYRVVDKMVLISIISATTVQFGAISIGVSSWLFPQSIRRR